MKKGIGKAFDKILKDGEDVEIGYHTLSNLSRREIFSLLTKRPCITSSYIGKILNIDTKTVLWHLRILSRNGYVVSTRYNKLTLYYPKQLIHSEDVSFFYIVSKNKVREILHLLNRKKEIMVKDIKKMAKATIYRTLAQLMDINIIVWKRTTRGKIFIFSKKFYLLKDKYLNISKRFKNMISEKLDEGDYDVTVLGTIDYSVKIRIEKKESFVLDICLSPINAMLVK